ncbi:HipA domain-containing protein, partial [Desulfurivibrio sp. D14AmB]|uniref:HipA domain-containing protein n=1 Tax=Desulfurivibrio sp. D14AmB TaxID=3374370 RepID=UPI00376EF1BD
LVERFDTTPQGGRNALVSMRTLTGAEDPFVISYDEMAGILRRFSFQPERDLAMLFRQLAVNLHLQNTDDHLQNFACLHTGEGWRLSPAYDIVPNIFQTEHILLVNGKHREVEYADLVAEGRRFGLSSRKIARLYDQVRSGLARWLEVFEECRVPMEHTRALRASIARKSCLLARP